jgi:hypothetical protein
MSFCLLAGWPAGVQGSSRPWWSHDESSVITPSSLLWLHLVRCHTPTACPGPHAGARAHTGRAGVHAHACAWVARRRRRRQWAAAPGRRRRPSRAREGLVKRRCSLHASCSCPAGLLGWVEACRRPPAASQPGRGCYPWQAWLDCAALWPCTPGWGRPAPQLSCSRWFAVGPGQCWARVSPASAPAARLPAPRPCSPGRKYAGPGRSGACCRRCVLRAHDTHLPAAVGDAG